MEQKPNGISTTLRRNIWGSSFFKGVDVLFNLLLVRYAILFFGQEDYGVWLTVLSVFTWFSVLEFGISSSFRNRMTQYFADQKTRQLIRWTRKGYKTSIVVYGLTVVLTGVLFFGFRSFLENYRAGFSWTVLLCFVLYMLHYIFFFLHTVLLATHHATATYVINAVQKGVLLLGILAFMQFGLEPSLGFVCFWFSLVPLLVWSLANGISYHTYLKRLKPGIRAVFKEKTKPLKQLRGTFFVIQVCTLAVYSTDHLIILASKTGTDVTAFGVAFKYFNSIIILFNIVLLPYWSSFTEAAHRKDHQWIKKHIRKLIGWWATLFILGIIMLLIATPVYNWWIGADIGISFWLSAFMLLFVMLTCWNNIFAYFLNSIDETRRQMHILIWAALINIPLTIWLLNVFNLSGVVLASCLVLLPLSIALPLKYRQIIQSFS